jgi:lipoprotein-anchoring transpeptidase ErfK/SrfK
VEFYAARISWSFNGFPDDRMTRLLCSPCHTVYQQPQFFLNAINNLLWIQQLLFGFLVAFFSGVKAMKEKQGDKTMRRHLENQIESGETGSLGILVLFVMWMLALMALSAAARGEDKPNEISIDGSRDGAQHRLSAQHYLRIAKANNEMPPQQAQSPAQPESSETLTRFILISIPDRRLALVDDGQVVRVYPIAVGATHTPSPQGNFTIARRVANPTWSHKGKVVGPGKSNPVGSRWMGLSLKGYGIHGTNAPRSIGKAASHGCFRMGKKDVEELFALVNVGDTVAVRAERDELVEQVFGAAGSGEVQVASTSAATVDVDEENQ